MVSKKAQEKKADCNSKVANSKYEKTLKDSKIHKKLEKKAATKKKVAKKTISKKKAVTKKKKRNGAKK